MKPARKIANTKASILPSSFGVFTPEGGLRLNTNALGTFIMMIVMAGGALYLTWVMVCSGKF